MVAPRPGEAEVPPEAEEVLRFWYSPAVRPRWFSSTDALDREIEARFGSLVEAAMAGALASWERSARGALALVIVLDQFPLNMYRGEARGYAGEEHAREVAGRAVDRGLDHTLGDHERVFLYMPYMHSEDLSDQDLAVRLFEQAGLDEQLRYARGHRAIVRRFGRFPHRNEALGRASTREEQDYLASGDAFRG